MVTSERWNSRYNLGHLKEMFIREVLEDNAADDLDLVVQVAEKYYMEQLTQSQIAEQFGVSRSTISRLLSRAREEGIVRIQIVRPQVRQPELEASLRRTFHLSEAIVISLPKRFVEDDELRRWVGIQAAQFVDPMIQPRMTVGIGRGRTLAELAYGLSKLAIRRDLTLVQLLGDIGIRYSPTRSTEITRLLSESYGGEGYYLNAPALVADAHLGQALMRSPNIEQVSKFYDSLDFAMAGVGSLHNSPLVLGGLLNEAEIQQLARAGAVGDICGHFYNIEGELVDHAYAGVAIGISWQQLHNCRRLLVIATGEDKAAPLLGLLRIRMIDVLVTDEYTARRLQSGESTPRWS